VVADAHAAARTCRPAPSTSPKPFITIAGALAGQREGDAQADAAGGAGDEGGLAFQHVEFPLVVTIASIIGKRL
jgi:hypothetical protein